jgi:hypothetical protein
LNLWPGGASRARKRLFCPLSRRSLGRTESPSAKPTEDRITIKRSDQFARNQIERRRSLADANACRSALTPQKSGHSGFFTVDLSGIPSGMCCRQASIGWPMTRKSIRSPLKCAASDKPCQIALNRIPPFALKVLASKKRAGRASVRRPPTTKFLGAGADASKYRRHVSPPRSFPPGEDRLRVRGLDLPPVAGCGRVA